MNLEVVLILPHSPPEPAGRLWQAFRTKTKKETGHCRGNASREPVERMGHLLRSIKHKLNNNNIPKCGWAGCGKDQTQKID